ncbi:MAG: polysaccharide deacetylase [Armatimonadota bacterium]|nr:MAG: polysaccharide deacetylase [Armatimonadota bacterium]
MRAFVKSLIASYVYRRRTTLLQAFRGILILMYHEVVAKRDERFRLFPVLCTTPETFRQQMEWLQKHFEIISIYEAEQRLRQGAAADSRAVVITSDDGWTGFYKEAVSLGIAATVYVATCALNGRLPWYVRWRLLLKHDPYLLKPLAHELGDFEPFPDADTAIDRLKKLDIARIERLWESIARESGFREESLPADWFVNREQVRQAASSAITIGSHTVNHPLLTHERTEVALDESRESKKMLESLLGQPVKHFAYPNGDHDDRVAALVAEAGYATAVTTQPGWNLPGEHLYRLKRVDVHEAACVDHRGRFSEAMFALWITGEWTRVKSKLRFL